MLKVVKSIPTIGRKKKYGVREEVLSFWANEDAKYAEVDIAGYKNIDSARATYRGAINDLFLRIRTIIRDDKLYLIKGGANKDE